MKAAWGRIALIVGLAAAVVTVGVWQLVTRAPTRPGNLLLITLDTTRADHLGCYGCSTARTPALDELAAGGVAFDQAFTSVPLTLPSHATILTGLHPPEHGLRVNGTERLDLETPTLAEVLAGQGYQTAAFIASVALDSRNGLDRGFEVYDDDMSLAHEERQYDPLARYRSGDLVTTAALEWLAGRDPQRPFFCWVHLYDPHLPYYPHPELDGTPFQDRASYEAEIAFMDLQVARLTAFVTDAGLADTTVVLAVGDHGEALGEHGEQDHGYLLYEPTLHVPLVFSCPARLPQGERIGAVVSLVDLFPTVLEVLGIEQAEDRSGRSLAAALSGNPLESVPAYSETELPFTSYHWSPARSLTTPDWKYIRSARVRLFDRRNDPGERHNLVDTHAETVVELEDLLQQVEAEMTVHAAARIEQTGEMIRRLEALGYVSGGGEYSDAEQIEYASLRDMEDMLPVFRMIQEALSLRRDGKDRERIEVYRRILERSPESVRIRYDLAGALTAVGDLEEARIQLEEVLAADPQNTSALNSLGLILRDQGELDEAIARISKVLEIKPDQPLAHRNLGDVYYKARRLADAARHYAEAARLDPQDASALMGWGVVLGEQGRFGEALDRLVQAAGLDAEDEQLRFLEGEMLVALGRLPEAVEAYRRALGLRGDYVQAANNLAWILATHPDAEVRNGAEAVRLAEMACQATGQEDPGFLDSLAAAYAEAGRFEEAVATARRARALAAAAGDQRLAQGIQTRLGLFEMGKPYRLYPAKP